MAHIHHHIDHPLIGSATGMPSDNLDQFHPAIYQSIYPRPLGGTLTGPRFAII